MHVKGLEPSRVAPLVPKTSASTDSAIRARKGESSPGAGSPPVLVLVVNRKSTTRKGVFWIHH